MLFGLSKPLVKLIDVVGGLLAVATLGLIVVLYLNGKFAFIKPETTLELSRIRELAIIAVLGLKALEFSLDRNLILGLIFIAITVLAFVLVFIPDTIPGWTLSSAMNANNFLNII